MRFHEQLEQMRQAGTKEKLELFDRAAFTLGFSSLSTNVQELMDTETAIALLICLLRERDLGLLRFVPVLLFWLRKYNELLNANKLLKMCQRVERDLCEGAAPLFRLVALELRSADPTKFKNFRLRRLAEPYYMEPRLRALVDMAIEKDGYYLGASPKLGLMFPASALLGKESDLLSEAALLKRNEQLRARLLFGVGYRADVVVLLRNNAKMSAREVAQTLHLSYEPAYRLSQAVNRYKSLNAEVQIERAG